MGLDVEVVPKAPLVAALDRAGFRPGPDGQGLVPGLEAEEDFGPVGQDLGQRDSVDGFAGGPLGLGKDLDSPSGIPEQPLEIPLVREAEREIGRAPGLAQERLLLLVEFRFRGRGKRCRGCGP